MGWKVAKKPVFAFTEASYQRASNYAAQSLLLDLASPCTIQERNAIAFIRLIDFYRAHG